MRRTSPGLTIIPGVLSLLCAMSAEGELVRFEILDVESPTFEGRQFGSVGRYEKIRARATLAVDPEDPHNSGIVDIELAPRNASGGVEAVADVYILKPVDLSKGGGRLFYEVLNRGDKNALALFNDTLWANANNPTSAADAGNGYLMREGYTVVWVGWQADVPRLGDLMRLEVPVLEGITETIRDEFIFDNDHNPFVATLSYPAADLDPSKATLTVRQRQTDPRVSPPDLSFEFFTLQRAGTWIPNPSQIVVQRPAGFDAGAIYEIVYEARDPSVMGLAFAATRDVVSFLRREKVDAVGNRNPLALGGEPAIRYAYGHGISQSGRYLRDFLYQGFNEDVRGRVVFDAINPDVAGSRKMYTNFRFAQPGRYSCEHENHLQPGDQFPFTYAVTEDPLTGRRDGILRRCLEAGNCPKIFHTDTATEFWQARSSLVVTDTRGRDIELPANVRAYLMASAPHAEEFGSAVGPTEWCQNWKNPLHTGAPMRALLRALDLWVREGVEPPDSEFPTRAAGTLVSADRSSVGFPDIPNANYSGVLNGLRVTDYTVHPPKEGDTYPLFVPKVDADGNDVAGIRVPDVEVPVATYLGWNLRRAPFAEGALCEVTGSTIPFPATRREREASGDPRLSLEERYPSHDAYVKLVSEATERLIQKRLLLEEDRERIMERARRSDIGKSSS